MARRSKRVFIIGLALALLATIPGVIWVSLTHQPRFYRAMVRVPRAQVRAEAKSFVAHSLQLRNDIVNEPTWEAVFTDHEVNAWLAEDLVTHFADLLPPEVREPRFVFEVDRVTLAFQLDQGPVDSVIWVVARARVPEENVVALTLEKIRAGVLPIPSEKIIDRITQHAWRQGLDLRWEREEGLPVAVIRYSPHSGRDDVVLEQLQLRNGQLRLAGRSVRGKGIVGVPKLPTRKVLQSKFPRRNIHDERRGGAPSLEENLRNSTSPTS